MNRVQGMIEALSLEMTESISKRQEELIDLFQTKNESITYQFEYMVTSIIDEKTECIVISYLRSSYITGSHKFKIAAYDGEPFLAELVKHINYSLDFLDISAEDITMFESKLKKLYIRVLSSEIEEIRRYYMSTLYENSIEFFRLAVSSMSCINSISPVDIYFGEEMGNIIPIRIFDIEQKSLIYVQ